MRRLAVLAGHDEPARQESWRAGRMPIRRRLSEFDHVHFWPPSFQRLKPQDVNNTPGGGAPTGAGGAGGGGDRLSNRKSILAPDRRHAKKKDRPASNPKGAGATGLARGATTVEGYYSIFKRGMIGTYQHCGEKHLRRYLAEFDFRYSNRAKLDVGNIARADLALKGAAGKRLTYQRVAV